MVEEVFVIQNRIIGINNYLLTVNHVFNWNMQIFKVYLYLIYSSKKYLITVNLRIRA